MIAPMFILIAALTAVSPESGENLGHAGPLNVACIECHTRLPFKGSAPALRIDAGDLCGTCHGRAHGADSMRSHPVNAVPTVRIPADMPLDKRGRIGCITCHAFHGEYRDEYGNKRFYLRRSPGKTFCYSCHKTLPGRQSWEIKP